MHLIVEQTVEEILEVQTHILDMLLIRKNTMLETKLHRQKDLHLDKVTIVLVVDGMEDINHIGHQEEEDLDILVVLMKEVCRMDIIKMPLKREMDMLL